MSKTISVEELPRKAERLLRTAWEEHESVVLERNGEPVAAAAPMDEYRRWHSNIQKADGKEPKSKKTAEPSESSLAYELPPDLLAKYHRWLDKKFSEGLTPEEETELERVGKELDEAAMNTPLGQAILTQAQEQHEQWMRRMDKVMETLRTLKELS